MASIVKKRNQYYARITYKVNDKRKEKTIPLKTGNKSKAKSRLKHISELEKQFRRKEIDIDKICVQEIKKIDELIEEFKEYKKLQNIEEKTQLIYKSALDNFKALLANRTFESLTKSDYQPMLRKLKDKYDNGNTINIYIRNINCFLRWAVKFDKIRKLPFLFETVRIPKKRPRYFTNAELDIIYTALADNEDVCNRVKLHVETGMRLRELHTSHIDGNIIQVTKSKGGTERSIPVSDEIAEIYKKCKEGNYTDTTISKLFKDTLVNNELYYLPSGDKRSFHCLRHTFAVKTYYDTRDIYRVCRLLGHANVTTSQIYANFDLAQLEKDFKPPDKDTKE